MLKDDCSFSVLMDKLKDSIGEEYESMAEEINGVLLWYVIFMKKEDLYDQVTSPNMISKYIDHFFGQEQLMKDLKLDQVPMENKERHYALLMFHTNLSKIFQMCLKLKEKRLMIQILCNCELIFYRDIIKNGIDDSVVIQKLCEDENLWEVLQYAFIFQSFHKEEPIKKINKKKEKKEKNLDFSEPTIISSQEDDVV
jgi:hypothetical protein